MNKLGQELNRIRNLIFTLDNDYPLSSVKSNCLTIESYKNYLMDVELVKTIQNILEGFNIFYKILQKPKL
jgi:hypothetical protein